MTSADNVVGTELTVMGAFGTRSVGWRDGIMDA